MRIVLKVMGRSLYEKLTKEMARLHSAFPRRFRQGKPIDWQLILLDEDLQLEDLVNQPPDLSVILIDAPDHTLIERLRSLEKRELLFLATSPAFPHGLAPVIVLFQPEALLPDQLEFPDIVSDWMVSPIEMEDMIRRLFANLKRKQLLRSELRFGMLSLLPESRKLCYSGDTAQLTPSELAVAELFLHHFGSVILLEDLILLFKLADRSIEGSNIRVTLFQLRFKVEAVSQCELTLMNVYKEGYSLRHSRNYDTGFSFPTLELRQELAVYGD